MLFIWKKVDVYKKKKKKKKKKEQHRVLSTSTCDFVVNYKQKVIFIVLTTGSLRART